MLNRQHALAPPLCGWCALQRQHLETPAPTLMKIGLIDAISRLAG